MTNRPVLAMTFYHSEDETYSNPFQKMVEEAKQERVDQEQNKV